MVNNLLNNANTKKVLQINYDQSDYKKVNLYYELTNKLDRGLLRVNVYLKS